MLYAFLCCHDEAVANSWTKEEDDAVLAKRHKVTEKRPREASSRPAVRLMPKHHGDDGADGRRSRWSSTARLQKPRKRCSASI